MPVSSVNPNGYGNQPGRYTAHRVSAPLQPDGRALSPAWANAVRTPRFVDMATGEPAPLDTTSAVLWDDTNLYIAFWASEPNLVATMTERGLAAVLRERPRSLHRWRGLLLRARIQPARHHLRGVLHLARCLLARRASGTCRALTCTTRAPTALVATTRARRAISGPATTPAVARWAFLDYDLKGLDVKTHYDGTLDDPSSIDRGWSAEIAIPWAGSLISPTAVPCLPNPATPGASFRAVRAVPHARTGRGRHRRVVRASVRRRWIPTAPECFTQVTFAPDDPPRRCPVGDLLLAHRDLGARLRVAKNGHGEHGTADLFSRASLARRPRPLAARPSSNIAASAATALP